MPLVSEMRHPRGLDFRNERKVVILRDAKGLAWDDIAELVVNLQGEASTADCVKRAYERFNSKNGRSKYFYARCGRKRFKLTQQVQNFLVRRLKELRKKIVVTSTTLQTLLASERGIRVSDSAIRKLLRKRGFKWLPRAQKRAYNSKDKKTRMTWVLQVNRMSTREVRERMAFCMDGVILTVPPSDPIERLNHCMGGETHMWRQEGETADPELAGSDTMTHQVPISRAIPLWGGISEGGFAEVCVHQSKKLSQDEWISAVRGGKLTGAIRQLKPQLRHGPWHVICDNEKFLHAKAAQEAYAARPVKMWHIPPRSPDLNPVERYWGWLRRQLRHKDLIDLQKKRPAIGKTAYLLRVRRFLKTAKAQEMAKKFASAAAFKRICKEVENKKGGAARC